MNTEIYFKSDFETNLSNVWQSFKVEAEDNECIYNQIEHFRLSDGLFRLRHYCMDVNSSEILYEEEKIVTRSEIPQTFTNMYTSYAECIAQSNVSKETPGASITNIEEKMKKEEVEETIDNLFDFFSAAV